MELFYRPKDAWVGDLIPYWEDETYYAFYLHDPRPEKGIYAEKTTWYLVSTQDFIHFMDHGRAIVRGGDDKPNKNIYTGSVFKAPTGDYYAFYTAFNENVKFKGKNLQSVMVARGKDILHLETDESFIMQADDSIYESFDWRDPFVFWNQEDRCYSMLLAARLKGSGNHRGGCIALCNSTDLKNWKYEQPFYAPNMYITMECPELFYMNGWWYLVFSTFSDRFVTHYRMAKSIHGPWIIPHDDTFDTRANYAIKTASDGKRRFAFGWIASKSGACDEGDWDWGGTMVIHELIPDSNTGCLKTVPSEGMLSFHKNRKEIQEWTLFNAEKIPAVPVKNGFGFSSDTLGAALFAVPEDRFEMEIDVSIKGQGEFGIALHTDTQMENGYFLRIDPTTGFAAWDLWPRRKQGKYQWQIAGDKPYMQETYRQIGKRDHYHIRIIREKEISVVYINGETALSCPLYNFKGGYAGPYIIQGTVHIGVCNIKTP
jgi:beta-fructofuranosidase